MRRAGLPSRRQSGALLDSQLHGSLQGDPGHSTPGTAGRPEISLHPPAEGHLGKIGWHWGQASLEMPDFRRRSAHNCLSSPFRLT